MESNCSKYLLGDIVDFTPKRTIKKGTIAPFVSMADIPENSKYIPEIFQKNYTGGGSRFSNGDTLFARITPCLQNGKTAKVSGLLDGSVAHGSTEFIIFAAKEPEYDQDYLYYLSRSPEFRAYAESRMQGSTGRQRVAWQALAEYQLNAPNKYERKLIGDYLAIFDQKIELNRQTNQTLEKMAQALFKSWFVDFDPVIDNALAVGTNISDFPEPLQKRAELRKTVQQSADAKKLPEDIRKLFPSEFEESEFGWVPKGWEIKVLGDLLEVKYGKDHKKLNDGEFPVYGSGGLMRFAEQYLYSGESVLIPRKGTLTNIMYVDKKFWTVDTMFYTIPKISNIAKFCFYHLKTLDFAAMNVGSAVPSMTTNVLNSLVLIKPTEAVLQKFDDILTSQFNKMASNKKESEQLEKLRDLLLPKLISGEITLPTDSRNCA